MTSSSTFRSCRDWSELNNLRINFPVIRHFSSSLQNVYSSEKLNGLSYYQNSIFFQLQGSPPNPLTRGPWTPLGALSPDPRYRLGLRARHVVPQCLEEIVATGPVDQRGKRQPSCRYLTEKYPLFDDCTQCKTRAKQAQACKTATCLLISDIFTYLFRYLLIHSITY